MRNFKQLVVWQRSVDLAESMYRITANFPRAESRGLIGQIRRSAGSVGANIAEGAGRLSPKDFQRFLGYSIGSLNELEHHCMVAGRVGYLNPGRLREVRKEISQIRAMAVALRNSQKR